MNREEAEKVVEEYNNWEDVSCSCHINPPCGKCTESPSEEEYLKALEVLDDK